MIIAIRLMRHQTDCFLCHPEMCAIPGEDGVHPCPVSSRSLPETEPIPKRVMLPAGKYCNKIIYH
jgi:hypothetical protein